ncbi:MAG: TraR/DksA C4-type zinc finger protein [Alphaproteobacteria bacterium]|nr:TraR/DksA C4-type zinc finger protein [Alphaproteobacteria bacterium]HPF45611.1 TraR/DksA C4-type zinc finger protein [Emcibacteraceae bacterium]
MSQTFNHFKKRLLEKRQALLSIIEGTKDNSKAVTLDQTSVGRLSRMDAMQGQAMAEEVKRRRQIDLKKIDAALARIEEGDFGYCLNCGEDIDQKRLEFDPSITLCSNCAR